MALDGREHYRNTSNRVRFFIWDAWAALPLPFLWFVKSWMMVIVALVSISFFFVLEKRGMTLPNFMRRLRTKISTPYKAVNLSKDRYLG